MTDMVAPARVLDAPRDRADVLADVLVEASASEDLDLVLDRIAAHALEGTGADRASIFLVEPDGIHLSLRAARRGDEPAPELWALGLSLPPIPLDDVPARRELFERGEAVAIPDARRSPLVPPEWADAFDLASLVVAPLRTGTRTLGMLVVDYRRPHLLDEQLVGLTAAIGRAAAVAVSSALLTGALRDRAASLQAMLDAARMLQSPRSLQETCEEVADAIAVVLSAPHLSVHLLSDERHFTTVAQRGVGLPDAAELRTLPLLARATVTRAWRDGAHRPVVLPSLRDRNLPGFDLPADVGSALVLPLSRPSGDLFGFILVGLEPESGPDTGILELAGALASHVAFAVDRAQLTEQVAIGAEFARTLLSLNDLDAGAGGLLAGLRREVPSTIGFEVLDVWVRSSDRRPSGPATEVERDLWRRWRGRRTRPAVEIVNGAAYAPLWTGSRVAGLLRARPLGAALAPHERDLLEALAAALGEWADRAQRDEDRRLAELQLALAEDRAMAAAELRDRLGRLVSMIVDHSESVAAGLHGESRRAVLRLASVARRALREAELEAGSVDAIRSNGSGLGASIDQLVNVLGRDLDLAVSVEVRGEPRPLPVDAEQVLLGVMQEVVRGVGALSRASALVVRVEFQDEAVVVVVRDDGVSLADRSDAFGAVPILPLRSAQERLESIGGRLTISQEAPRGLLLRAEVPA